MNTNTIHRKAITASLLLIAVALHGCATGNQFATSLPANSPEAADRGHLRVYTAAFDFANGDTTIAHPHTDYKIYDAHGAFVKLVRNHISPTDETPDRVDLPPGSYTVAGDSESHGFVSTRVLIKPYATTIVDLDHVAM